MDSLSEFEILTNNSQVARQRLLADTVLDNGLPFSSVGFLHVAVLDLVGSL